MRRLAVVGIGSLVLLALSACGSVVGPPRCVAFETYAMADSVSRAGSLDVCVAYE